jgi:uncharacterized protein YydD (DUF2326 family)
MRLIELTVARGGSIIRRVPFKPGLNLILDKPTATATQSGNSVGKTTVLRLIDFCFGSKGDDIWQDAEFKKSINQEVFDLLHGQPPVSITLIVEDSIRGKHALTRSFIAVKGEQPTFQIDNTSYSTNDAYKQAVKQLLFGASGRKPTLRQLIPKFVRSSPALMSKTLKFLIDFTTEADYEVVHLFLFGFLAVDVLEERSRLATQKKEFTKDWQTLNRLRKEGEIEQLLIHLRREIEEISQLAEIRGEVPEIAERANTVTAIRSKAAGVVAVLSRYDAEVASLRLAVQELESEYANIDRKAIESVYREAQNYIPKLHHDWNELTDFVQNLRKRKQRFLEVQIAELQGHADAANKELRVLQAQETNEIGSLVRSPEFVKALELRADLQDKLKKLGSLEQDLQDLRDLKTRLDDVEKKLKVTHDRLEQEKASLRERVSLFNRYFSELSKLLYGEQYLLHFDETDRGFISFQLSSVGSNVGAGKKASQTAAFDLAYIQFLRETGINFPKFVCHDGVEHIHANQLSALLMTANGIEGQLILATLRDKLPAMPGKFVVENTVLELSQDDKLFRI